MKKFKMNGIQVGFGVVETTDPESIKARIPQLLAEIPHVKQEQVMTACIATSLPSSAVWWCQGFDVFFFGIVDIVNMCSNILVWGPREVAQHSHNIIATTCIVMQCSANYCLAHAAESDGP